MNSTRLCWMAYSLQCETLTIGPFILALTPASTLHHSPRNSIPFLFNYFNTYLSSGALPMPLT